jgi:hypothetical protein
MIVSRKTELLRGREEESVPKKSTRKAPDYAVESSTARKGPVFRP